MNNMPPGCTAADGLTNPAVELAIEQLVDAIPSHATAEQIAAIAKVIPQLMETYSAGWRDCDADHQMTRP